ncbi:putative nuclease HARBI1 [Rhipicephalus sanguineus]|uniref:putative nuclease HARBI1 n=1 Tax=Rhipicephalus sanguineus TaxID=34632 RepID=UPI00189490CC|nr:putative nuclease HARBI1 [Rhipicephalus sanguineus]
MTNRPVWPSFFDCISTRVIHFPATKEEEVLSIIRFEKIPGYGPGCIDGTYVETRCPAHKIASTYTNRHDKKSYNVQAICDSDKKFVDVFLGNTGKTHDSEAFKRSFVVKDLPGICEGDQFHILGDAAYPLREYLLTPVRDYGNITPEEIEYNLRHSKTRVRIENAFGLLKGRFRQLLYLEFWSVKRATLFILACCVLHNLCIQAGDTELVDDEDTGCSQNDSKPNPSDLFANEDPKREKVLRRLGELKRKKIARRFSQA